MFKWPNISLCIKTKLTNLGLIFNFPNELLGQFVSFNPFFQLLIIEHHFVHMIIL